MEHLTLQTFKAIPPVHTLPHRKPQQHKQNGAAVTFFQQGSHIDEKYNARR